MVCTGSGLKTGTAETTVGATEDRIGYSGLKVAGSTEAGLGSGTESCAGSVGDGKGDT
mgnify:CR=1 FL=1